MQQITAYMLHHPTKDKHMACARLADGTWYSLPKNVIDKSHKYTWGCFVEWIDDPKTTDEDKAKFFRFIGDWWD